MAYISLNFKLCVFLFSLVCNSSGFLFWGTKEVCYHDDGIGCFSNAAPYNNAKGNLPESPDHIQIEYLLFTRHNTHAPQIITKDGISVRQSHFDGTKKTKFIIHGYQDNGRQQWLQDMGAAFLQKEDANVIAVNWAKGADNINYIQAAANTRVVGALIAELMKSLHTNAHAPYSSMHLIGHSLGSHIAGYAGERVHGTGRITGLDPAGPLFENQDKKVRLDPSDATFVDAIHTDADSLLELGFGLEKAIADVDYYPNGGEKQPGCPNEIGKHLFNLITVKIEDLKSGVACSHMRVIDFFIESIKSSHCNFRSYPCASKADFDAGRCSSCGHGCMNMGYHATQGHHHGKFYLRTSGSAPFCLG